MGEPENKKTLASRMSLRAKINLTVGLIFLLVLVGITSFAVTQERVRLMDATENQVKEITTLYFDSLNTMMLTGTMDQRSILRNKMLARKEVIEARVIRDMPVRDQFGPGYPEEEPLDEMDRRALQGEEIVVIERHAGQRQLTVLTPFKATENTRGVNCLQCHSVPPGSINGAVRLSYSLASIDSSVRHVFWVMVFFNLALFVIGLVLVNVLLKKWLINPLTRLVEVLNKRAQGDVDARAEIIAQDEIGQLGYAFNTMANKVNAIAAREHEAAEELKRNVDLVLQVVNKVAEGDFNTRIEITTDGAMKELANGLQHMIDYINRSIEEKREAVEILGKKVDRILEVVTRAADGDLTGSVYIEGNDALSKLAKGVQLMVANLNALVAQVQRSGVQVTSSAEDIAATAKQQEATVSDQALTTNQITATATQISDTTKELVYSIDELAKVAERSKSSASHGYGELERMQSTMQKIVEAAGFISGKFAVLNERALNINSVVTTITKIADQTNLLSLNAAIEAEKAGEYGLGFAVVATEIRRLADQTAVATLDIEQMVKEMQSAVVSGVSSMEKFSDHIRRSVADVNQVGAELAHVIEEVQTFAPRLENIQQGMHFQSQNALQIKQAMLQLSHSAQQTVVSIRQSSRAIDALNDAAQALRLGVTKFRVSKREIHRQL